MATQAESSAPSRRAPTPSPEVRSAESERRQRVIDTLLAGPIEGRQVDIARTLGIPVTSMRQARGIRHAAAADGGLRGVAIGVRVSAPPS